jgi:uncharacterized protein YyaL (SSP411 family)
VTAHRDILDDLTEYSASVPQDTKSGLNIPVNTLIGRRLMAEEQHTNRLIDETSPYLRQHAHNPVEWYPWGSEALERARAEDRPILLSVGYSACHWCHVMAHESFENEETAGLMNQHFVNIKVDREERPDLDEIYMGAVQAMTGSGGWPMTVFLAPDLRPFYGGTYFPPVDRHGHPGFPRILQGVAEHYRTNRDSIEEHAAKLTATLQQNAEMLEPWEQVGEDIVEKAFGQLSSSFDGTHGGFGAPPKFPGSMSLSLLLRHYRKSGNAEALNMVELSLKKMANGGMYDQLGGGFHRYSVDERWLVPHFEKMLYDNALLTWTYVEAYQVTGDDYYRRIVQETLDYVRREMTQPQGGFYAAQDADSEGEEGKFFAWVPGEIEAVLDKEEARLFARYYDVTPDGNFEHGTSILHVDTELPALARFLKADEETFRQAIEKGRRRLFEVRQQRVAPGRDEKILVSWNGLMISAMARAHQVLGVDAYLQAGQDAASFILGHMVEDGKLLHTYKDGHARLAAYQDDYACFINGLLDLYEASLDMRWLRAARELNQVMIDRFWDREKGGFFFTEEGAEDLIVRTKNPFDNATPSGNSIAALVLLRLAALSGDAGLREKAEQTFRLFSDLMTRAPSGCAQMICALDFYRESPYEIAIVGRPEDRKDFLQALHGRFLPHKVLMGGDPSDGPEDLAQVLPLLEEKMTDEGRAMAYVCRHAVCSQPVSEVEALLSLLESR